MRYRLSKQALDKTVAGLALVVLSPLIAGLLLAMGIDMLLSRRDRGTWLYREQRISRGRTFDLLKFRTLRSSVLDEMRRTGSHARLYEADPANLTWAGRHLLKPWYLDELPQFLNVLKGDISLVGPRPWPPPMVSRQVAEGLTYRNEVVAGLTGPAQVTKGSDQLFADLDVQYAERYRTATSLGLVRYDVSILAATIRVLARGQGLSN